MAHATVGSLGLVWWKDLQTGQWNGPDPYFMWGRGHACIFPESGAHPIWVPEHAIRHHHGRPRTIVQMTETYTRSVGPNTHQKQDTGKKEKENLTNPKSWCANKETIKRI